MKTITNRPKTIEQARKLTGRPKVDFSNVPEDLREFIEGIYDGVVVTEAINGKWTPDWENDEPKWAPWFDMSPSSFGYYRSCRDYEIAFSGSGSRFRNRTMDDAKYSGQQFKDIWRKIQLG